MNPEVSPQPRNAAPVSRSNTAVLEELFPAVEKARIASVLASVEGDVPMATALLLSELEAAAAHPAQTPPARNNNQHPQQHQPNQHMDTPRMAEVLWRVLSVLTDRELAVASLVCKAWRRAAQRPELWRSRIRSRFPNDALQSV